jgi:Bacterial capsule synthesis protein PGA_cap
MGVQSRWGWRQGLWVCLGFASAGLTGVVHADQPPPPLPLAQLQCQMRLADQAAELRAWPDPDPYVVVRQAFDERFSLSAVVMGVPSGPIEHITLTVHDLSQGGVPVPVQQMHLLHPFAQPASAQESMAPTLTGWQRVYVGTLGREFEYGCALVQAAQSALPVVASTVAPPALRPAQVSGTKASTEAVVRMAWLGDVMLADGPGRLIRKGGNPFGPTARSLADADVRVANLECVVATAGKALDKPWTFRAHPRVLPLLKRHVDVVSLANNHSGDFGPKAFADMLRRLEAAGLPYFGGGRDLRQAHQPLIIERKGIRIALLAYDEMFPRVFEAGPDWPGVAWSEDQQVAFDIRQARLKADVVIPYMHWGQEHEPQAHARQRQLARLMIDAGADAVVGTHPHVVQDVERYRGKPIFYSLGNFVFDGFSSRDNNTGWVLWLEVSRSGVQQWRVQEVHQDRDGTPHPLRQPTPQPPMPESGVPGAPARP